MGQIGGDSKQAYIPQELLREISKVNNRLLIGIPRERGKGERRMPLTPEGVEILTGCGHQVLVESNAGLGINYSDNHFSEAGAVIVETPAEVFQADIIIKILPPLAEEVALMKSRSILLSMVQFNIFETEAYLLMMEKRITAISYELITDERGSSPVLNTSSEIEGATSITIASHLLSNLQGGKGILLGGVPGVPPTEIVIIGAGTAGTVAARAALGLGALVKVFDEDINNLRAIQSSLGQKVFTSNFHPKVLQNAFKTADVIIGAMRYINARRHYVISEELIRTLKKGALVIDLRINQGGCFETTCGLKDSDPAIFEQYGVLHYCKANISNYVARTTSMAYSNLFVPILLTFGDMGAIQMMIRAENGFRNGVYMYHGKPVNEYVSSHFNIISGNLDIYLAAF
ncbi:alanine dehydrogenase [Parabacteroides sp. Marseille-P3160]|uniref:alanine dehydrogenase n=1 Tax=Parabacteroides sp. Marseille-P3160 TaxID=1917887 RepID=UPI0009BB8676|nr:alanine dehydrogenase [Parabacteroides sp. Marseille-P3160]